MNPQKQWHKILEIIKSELPAHNFRAWFAITDIKEITETSLIIITPSAFIKEQLGRRYLDLIEKAAQKVCGRKMVVNFVVDSSRLVKKDRAEGEGPFFATQEKVSSHILNSKFTLENFVVGLSNNVAYAAAQAVVQNPGSSYNPLFFYGGTGVGKTHLMLGIGNAILARRPETKVIYCSSEKFTNDYVEAIQTRKMGELRHRYRSADLLLIDDIQFFSGREGTQEEFFHTFNDLQSKNCQIVLTSDRAPHEVEKLEDRLKSRFQGGLMVDIQLPDFDTRVAILRAKCLERGESVPEESLNLIAKAYETNARELEGKLIQIIQILKIQNKQPLPEIILEFIGNATKSSPVQNVSYRQVLNAICSYFNIKTQELLGPRRQKELVLPRHLAMHILSEDLKMTVEKIGEVLGGRDHTTVMHGRDKVKRLLQTDKQIQKMFMEIRQSLAG